MAEKTLSRNALAFGRAVLLASDAAGLKPEGAFWLYDSKDEEWRYFLVSSLLERIGSYEIFLKLRQALEQRLSAQEVDDFPFYLASPNDGISKAIRKEVSTNLVSSEISEVSARFRGGKIPAFVYRLAEEMNERDRESTVRQFRRGFNELQMA
jgi:hypothetical protein